MKKTYTLSAALVIVIGMSLSNIAFAQSGSITGGIGALSGVLNDFTNKIVTALITLFATAALAAFFFGVVRFIMASRDGVAAEIEKGKTFMVWGMVALFVMFSVWGIINYAQTIFGVSKNEISIPTIRINGSTAPAPAPTAPGLPVPPPAAAGADGCTVVNASCKNGSGQAGHCKQGALVQNYALYCALDPAAPAPAPTPAGSTACPNVSEVRDPSGACVSSSNY